MILSLTKILGSRFLRSKAGSARSAHCPHGDFGRLWMTVRGDMDSCFNIVIRQMNLPQPPTMREPGLEFLITEMLIDSLNVGVMDELFYVGTVFLLGSSLILERDFRAFPKKTQHSTTHNPEWLIASNQQVVEPQEKKLKFRRRSTRNGHTFSRRIMGSPTF